MTLRSRKFQLLLILAVIGTLAILFSQSILAGPTSQGKSTPVGGFPTPDPNATPIVLYGGTVEVVATPLPPTPTGTPLPPKEVGISNISRSGYVNAMVGQDDEYYIDRSYIVTNLPPALEGLMWIKTANDDKYNSEANFLSFDVDQDVTIYIGYDNRATALPTWMNTYEPNPLEIAVSDSPASPLQVWQKDYAQGTITLGGNHQGGDTGAKSNYVILVASR